jgi:hypothetical protein
VPMNELWAYLGLDEEGKEGFVLVMAKQGDTDMMVQLVAPTKEIAETYREFALSVAQVTKRPIRLVKFSNPEEIEKIS